MKKFIVTVKETDFNKYVVEAETAEDAQDIALEGEMVNIPFSKFEFEILNVEEVNT